MSIGLGHWVTFTESVSTAPPHVEALVDCFLLPVGVSYPALHYACFCDSVMGTAPLVLLVPLLCILGGTMWGLPFNPGSWPRHYTAST